MGKCVGVGGYWSHCLEAPLDALSNRRDLAIWGYAFGYFACYAPYSALTKALSSGLLQGMAHGIEGFALLPATTMASLVGMFTFLTAMGWWRYAKHRQVLGLSLPSPTRWTFLSGLCSAAIIGTTTLAYTFDGTSIVFMMLMMRGGVLMIAPIVDAVSRRRVRWPSWVALGLSLGAVVVASAPGTDLRLSIAALIDLGVYLVAYFIRLRAMSNLAKSEDRDVSIRYFVEEQMVATPAIVLTLAVLALVGEGRVMLEIREGFTGFLTRGRMLEEVCVGLLSQGTGVFGGLILLDHRENAFTVPVNRASSILAGVLATAALSVWLGQRGVGPRELTGAGLVMAAMLVLSVPTVLKARRERKAAADAPPLSEPGSK